MKQILRELNQKPIAYYPVYRQITGSTTGGILLSQLMYWFAKKDKIFKTDKEIMEETLLSEKELKNAKKLIKQLDFITVSREGIPAKTYYEIDWEKFENCLQKKDKTVQTSESERDKQDCPNGPNCTVPNGQSNKNNNYSTETTTEKKSKKKFFTPDDLEIARHLFSKLKQINPKQKEPNWNTWANDARLLRERDGRETERIINIIDKIFEYDGVWDGSFWKANIQSVRNLRKHYDRIYAQITMAYKQKGAA